MSGKQEKALRRAFRVVETMVAHGVSDAREIAARIGLEETVREEAIARRRAEREEEKRPRRWEQNHPREAVDRLWRMISARPF